jgi:hypothetical protein
VDDASPEMPPVPVLVPLMVADALALGVTDVVWLEVADALALFVTDVEPEDDPVLVSEADMLDAAGARASPTAGGRRART